MGLLASKYSANETQMKPQPDDYVKSCWHSSVFQFLQRLSYYLTFAGNQKGHGGAACGMA